jgi:hypothetical protein
MANSHPWWARRRLAASAGVCLLQMTTVSSIGAVPSDEVRYCVGSVPLVTALLGYTERRMRRREDDLR